MCTSNFAGSYCQTGICPGGCGEPSNGVCDTSSGVPICSCFSNASMTYYGSNCEQVTTGCPPSCAPPYGTCNGTQCMCSPSFTGASCNIPFCLSNCNGNGVCEFNSTTQASECHCLGGFTGAQCQTDPLASCNCSLNGVCALVNSAATCICSPGWEGADCSQVQRSSTGLSAGAWVGIAFSIAAVGVLVAVAVLLWHKHHVHGLEKWFRAHQSQKNLMAAATTMQ